MKSNIFIKCGVAALTIYSICLTYVVFFKNNNTSVNTDIVDDSDMKQDLYQRIIKYGDTIAYNHLIDSYGSPNNLIYSIFMADRYGYPVACQNVYTDLAGVMYAYHGIVPDSIVTNLTLSCLYRGGKDKGCCNVLGMLYTTGYMVEKDTTKGRYYTELAFRDEGKDYVDRLMKMYLSNRIFDLPKTIKVRETKTRHLSSKDNK